MMRKNAFALIDFGLRNLHLYKTTDYSLLGAVCNIINDLITNLVDNKFILFQHNRRMKY